MSTLTKTKTWALLDQPLASDVNANFDTLYAGVTAGGVISQRDGSQAFTAGASTALLPVEADFPVSPAVPFPTDPKAAIGAEYAWYKSIEFVAGTSCWLHGGTHAIPGGTTPYWYCGTTVSISDGGGGNVVPITPFPNDILTVILQFGDSPGTSFTTQTLCAYASDSTLSSIHWIIGSHNVQHRINYFVLGW